MNEQTLELQIQSSSKEALNTVNKLVSLLTNVNKNVESISQKINTSNGVIKNTSKTIDSVKSSTDKATNSANKLGNAFKNAFTFTGVKSITKKLLGWMDEAIDYTEQLNLFNVVFDNAEKDGKKMFSNLGLEATKFQNKLNETFGTNKTETLYMQGIYQSMGETVGIKDEYSAIMSETMTKLTYDLASLYNKSEDKVAEALRAGVYAGQTKPMRSYGIDVTQTTLQPILDSLGIDEQVKNLSQAEKEILRYLATLKQAKVAMGDFANNLESPSNQLKIFKQQLVEAKVALSSLFIGAFAKILPYANAFLMVIKEVSSAIATMFGIELTDYNTGIASQEGIYDGIADSADNASKKAKELKRQVFGWDEIHNINEDKDSGSSGSSGVSGGIDQRLLDAIKGYDNGMDKVKMKATEIRDKIMGWLGFTKEIDPLTGKVSFKYQGIQTTLKNMWKSFKGLSTEGKILVGLGLVVGATKLWNVGKKLVTVFGNSGLCKIIKTILTPFKSLGTNMLNLVQYTRIYTKLSGNLKDGILSGIDAWRKQNIIVKDSYGNIDKLGTAMNGAKTAVSGLVTGLTGMYAVHESMESLTTDGLNLANALGLVSGSVTTIASGVQIGAIFGPWGAVIGGAAGALLDLVSAMQGYQTEMDKMINKDSSKRDSINEYLKSLESENDAIQENLNANLSMTKAHSTLVSELESITDANGKVKKGYEERANYILGTLKSAYGIEYELTNGQISNYDTLIKKIKKTIETKNAEILAEAGEEKYALLLKEETELWDKKNTAVKNHEKYAKDLESAESELKDVEETINAYMKAGLPITKDLKTKKQELKTEVKKLSEEEKKWKDTATDATNKYKTNIIEQTKYSNLQEAIINGNYDEINKAVKQFTDSYVENGETVKLSLADRLKKEQETADIVLATYKEKYGEEIPEELKKSAYICLDETISSLTSQTKEVKDGKISKELAEAWYTLGTTNKDKFLENFGQLPTDIRQKVVDKMYDEGYNISSELQNGIKQIKPEINIKTKTENATVKIDADTSQAKKKTDSWLKDVLKKMGGAFGISIGGGFRANGGIYSNGSWKNIKQYANGGAPSHGSMFVAGEHGAEIVGHINGRTEVLNQSQIASAIYSAVYSAMSQFSGSGIAEINVHADEGIIVETAINGINQKTKQTGVCPVNIPF